MDINPIRDLIKDEYGNYYVIIKMSLNDTENKLTIVNAFVHMTFRRILHFDKDFQNDFKDYEWQYIGKFFMDMLKNRVKGIEKGDLPGNIYNMEEIKQKFKLDIIHFYEKSPQIK